MSFEKINILQSPVVATSVENIDTDQIIPARFLKATTREGFGDAMFRDWRFNSDGSPVRDSVFATAPAGAKILVAGRNFGCGSSREHAAWALADYGFRAVVSSFFADIFKNNALNNCLLPVVVSDGFLARLFDTIATDHAATVTINLPEQTVTNDLTGESEHFDITPYKKDCLLNGFDDIDFLIDKRETIESWEKTRNFNY